MNYKYKYNKEDLIYANLIDKNYFFLYSLIPNQINIFPLFYLNPEVIKFIKANYKNFFILIYPVYKHKWKFSNLSINNNYINLENKKNISANNFFNYKINIDEVEENLYQIKYKAFTFSLEAFSFYIFNNKKDINIDNISSLFILGLVESAIKLSIISVPFFNLTKNSLIYSTIFTFKKINLKSLYISNQIRIFETWYNEKNVIITGGTGIGKTSQIPKLFWWINYLFDGFQEFNIRKFNKNNIITNKKTILSLPRKILITQNGTNIIQSFGYTKFNNSPVSCLFKNVKETEYYNKNVTEFLNPFLLSINRLTINIIQNTNTIIYDEIHEHDTFGDIGIMIARNKKNEYNIRNIVLITATIEDDWNRIKEYFSNLTHIDIKGDYLFPIEKLDLSYKCNFENKYINVNNLITKYCTLKGKSTIFFLPTIHKIKNMNKYLGEKLDKTKYRIIELHSRTDLSILNLIETVKNEHILILSSPIAESSLTIRNAVCVIDTGRFYNKCFYGGKEIYITQSMKTQRKGRIGRVAKGLYIQLFNDKKLNLNYKKIDYEFLFPYILNCLKFKINFNNMFILPSNMNRINDTIIYFKKKSINLEENIDKIFYIFNTENCNLYEYIYIYLYGTSEEKQILHRFENLETDIKEFIYKNEYYIYKIFKKINLELLISFKNKHITFYKLKDNYDINNEYSFILEKIKLKSVTNIYMISNKYCIT